MLFKSIALNMWLPMFCLVKTKMSNGIRHARFLAAMGVLAAVLIIAGIAAGGVYFPNIRLPSIIPDRGTLTILVTDPPEWGEVTHVYINITKIEIHSNSSGWSVLAMPEGVEYLELNLTKILDTEAHLLQAPLGPGKYNILRFEISSAIVTVYGSNRTDIKVPSGKINIAIIQGGVTIQAGQESKLLLDIETRVVYSKGQDQYQLVPAAKAIPISG